MSREVMQVALDALKVAAETSYSETTVEMFDAAIEALRAELAKTEPEPIMWTRVDLDGMTWIYGPDEDHHEDAVPLYRKEDV